MNTRGYVVALTGDHAQPISLYVVVGSRCLLLRASTTVSFDDGLIAYVPFLRWALLFWVLSLGGYSTHGECI
jgi:hypothetical protein